MQIRILIPGKIKSEPLRELLNYYAKLTGKYYKTSIEELHGDQNEALLKWMAKNGARAFLTVLDERGKTFDSRGFAAQISKIRDASMTDWVLAVGGEHGYSDAVKKHARLLLSLSPMTLPHELATVVLAEQIFRGCSIEAGHPYHND